MTPTVDADQCQYYAVCPRGFANEVIYFRVNPEDFAACEALFSDPKYGPDGGSGAWCGWTKDRLASQPGRAVDWADRHLLGF